MEKVINLSPDLKQLQDDGYEIEVKNGNIIIYNIPYLNSKLNILKGILISPLTMMGNVATYRRDGNHVVYFSGDIPYRADGSCLNAIYNSPVVKEMSGITVNHMFSNKPINGYNDYYEKMVNYITIISSEARAIDPLVTAKTYKKIISDEDSIFVYEDTNSSRANITDVSSKLKGLKIGIIGLGGTGSYILDQVAKTPVAEIQLFDGDIFCQHNAYRAPGAPDISIISAQPYKTDYFKSIYSHMHQNIVSNPVYITDCNIDCLSKLDYVFLSLDSGEIKKTIIDFLIKNNIKCLDTGIDVLYNNGFLLGMSRVTRIDNKRAEEALRHISFEEPDDNIYQSNIQIADLNNFCAAVAVMEWKKDFGFYQDISHKCNINFSTNDGEFK